MTAAPPPRDGGMDRATRAEVLRGLRGTPRTLPWKLLYDSRGAALFERICQLPEYYLTRAEHEILRSRAPAIARLAGRGCVLLDYGSGSSTKARVLLEAMHRPVAYVPIDVACGQLRRTAEALSRVYPTLPVRPVCADYTRAVRVRRLPTGARRIALFAGSSIGNFHPDDAVRFLRRVRTLVGDDGAMVLGLDRRKDPRVLHAAYNDRAGVTARFNLNVLTRLNRELGAHFERRQFRHLAYFNAAASRIEMHLESTRDQVVRVAGMDLAFCRGETIWTESSYKFDRAMVDTITKRAGFAVARVWTDSRRRFWVVYLTASAVE